MNHITREIQQRFNVATDIAIEIQTVMDCDVYFDASEMSQTEMDAAYDEAFSLWLDRNAVLVIA